MAIHLYAVLDADGVKVNTISAEESLLETNWYPGYGAYLVDEGLMSLDPPLAPPPVKPETFKVLPFVLAEPMQNGDTMDVKTGEVTKKSLDGEVIVP